MVIKYINQNLAELIIPNRSSAIKLNLTPIIKVVYMFGV